MKFRHFNAPQSQLIAVDLFAGAGGFSLGLHRAGFQVVLANESSVDAEWTYRRNLVDPNENPWLFSIETKETSTSHKALRAIGRKAITNNRMRTDNQFDQTMRGGKIGDALCDEWIKSWLKYHNNPEIDILVAGPPCQGFSTAGKQDDGDERNQLIWEAVRVAKIIHPKMIIIENVPGMLARHSNLLKSVGDNLAIGPKGYYLAIELLHAKEFGVPQTRKRLVVVGVRKDLMDPSGHFGMRKRIFPVGCLSHRSTDDLTTRTIRMVRRGDSLIVDEIMGDLTGNPPIFESTDKPQHYRNDCADLGEYQIEMRTPKELYLRGGVSRSNLTREFWNHESSRHNDTVVARIKKLREAAQNSINGIEQRTKSAQLKKHFNDSHPHLYTKKAAQRVLLSDHWPDLTVTSLPDDIVHFSENRIPTVREMARLQTFPDWFEFCGVRTTGFERRKAGIFVPQYTQVANAVPPRLAFAIATRIKYFLHAIANFPKCDWNEGQGIYQHYNIEINPPSSSARIKLDELNDHFQQNIGLSVRCSQPLGSAQKVKTHIKRKINKINTSKGVIK